jgi:hypothetical protein
MFLTPRDIGWKPRNSYAFALQVQDDLREANGWVNVCGYFAVQYWCKNAPLAKKPAAGFEQQPLTAHISLLRRGRRA